MARLNSYIIFVLFFSTSYCKKTTPIEKEKPFVAPISIEGIVNRSYKATLKLEEELDWTDYYRSELMSFYSDSLKVYTLVNIPETTPPERGYPVLIFAHGYHPDPKTYSMDLSSGITQRPDAYYKGLPEAYAEKGYIVFSPDYRGHNLSQGYDYTQTSYLDASYYAIDVLHLIAAIPKLEYADTSNFFLMGHSLGGEVGLITLLATDKIKAASLWAPASASTWEQVYFHSKENAYPSEHLSPESFEEPAKKLKKIVGELGYPYDVASGDPIYYLQQVSAPIIIHHARWEGAVPYHWSEALAAKLFEQKKYFELYTYDSENHLLLGANRKLAVERDIRFFQQKAPGQSVISVKDF